MQRPADAVPDLPLFLPENKYHIYRFRSNQEVRLKLIIILTGCFLKDTRPSDYCKFVKKWGKTECVINPVSRAKSIGSFNREYVIHRIGSCVAFPGRNHKDHFFAAIERIHGYVIHRNRHMDAQNIRCFKERLFSD